jgi:hypothetical protein
MSRVLAAALAVAAARGAAAAVPVSPTLVLSSAPTLGGAAPGAVSYESLTQSELAAGLLRASGAAPAQQAGWEARHWPAGEESPELLAVLVGSVQAGRQVRTPCVRAACGADVAMRALSPCGTRARGAALGPLHTRIRGARRSCATRWRAPPPRWRCPTRGRRSRWAWPRSWQPRWRRPKRRAARPAACCCPSLARRCEELATHARSGDHARAGAAAGCATRRSAAGALLERASADAAVKKRRARVRARQP